MTRMSRTTSQFYVRLAETPADILAAQRRSCEPLADAVRALESLRRDDQRFLEGVIEKELDYLLRRIERCEERLGPAATRPAAARRFR